MVPSEVRRGVSGLNTGGVSLSMGSARAAWTTIRGVTGAETCELVLAPDALGQRERALEQFAAMQHLGGREQLLPDRSGARGQQAMAGGAHDMDGRGGDSRGVRTLPHDAGIGTSGARTWLPSWQ